MLLVLSSLLLCCFDIVAQTAQAWLREPPACLQKTLHCGVHSHAHLHLVICGWIVLYPSGFSESPRRSGHLSLARGSARERRFSEPRSSLPRRALCQDCAHIGWRVAETAGSHPICACAVLFLQVSPSFIHTWSLLSPVGPEPPEGLPRLLSTPFPWPSDSVCFPQQCCHLGRSRCLPKKLPSGWHVAGSSCEELLWICFQNNL